MAKVEKVLSGLECCKVWDNAGMYEGYMPEKCEGCPYYNEDITSAECHESLLSDAYDLLKSYAEADLIERGGLIEHIKSLATSGTHRMIWSRDVLEIIEEERWP